MVYYRGKKRVTRKFHRCVKKVSKRSPSVNPYAVCMKSLKITKVKRHRKSKRRR